MSPTASSPVHRNYVVAVVVTGLGIVAFSLWELFRQPPGLQWFVLAALTLLTGSFTVKLPSLPAKISVSETFVFTSVLLFGPAAGTITVVLDALVISLWMRPEHRLPARVFFNATAPAIAIRSASEVFFQLSGAAPGQIVRDDVAHLIAPVFAFALLYFFVNTALVAGALATERNESPASIWLANFPPVSITYFVGSSVAMLIVAYTDRIDLTVLSIIVPLVVISYLTFRTSMGRLTDAQQHVAQVNELYLSTIETLAMAVDAKDQVTHGHIRRVQVYTVELAKLLGVRDAQHLRAIETAALLHDMGKLAIPEHILNKPGKLTSAEFDVMKRHADIGADLLSSIKFPYPVVPIVRHHHEHWNGGGYPAGISGNDIPLGARILSVVDCFDALNSDRPYRPRLSADESFEILRSRRGTMYDPLVVDTFIAAYPEIAPLAIKAGHEARSIIDASNTSDQRGDKLALSHIRANASDTALLNECAQSVANSGTSRDALEIAGQTLRQLTPVTTLAAFRYDPSADSLTCDAAVGDPSGLLLGLSIRLGERVSGWVGANRRAAVNSNAFLDLAHIAGSFEPSLRSTIAVPVLDGDRLVGVLSGYSSRHEPFSEAHRYAMERVASFLSERLKTFRTQSVIAFPVSKTS